MSRAPIAAFRGLGVAVPGAGRHQRRPEQDARHLRPVDRGAHRHPRAARGARRRVADAAHRRGEPHGAGPRRHERRRPRRHRRRHRDARPPHAVRRPATCRRCSAPIAPPPSTSSPPARASCSPPAWPRGSSPPGPYKNVLVLGAERLSTITDWQDRSTAVLFGDGAGAAVLTPGQRRRPRHPVHVPQVRRPARRAALHPGGRRR